jgi:hypothetical protein
MHSIEALIAHTHTIAEACRLIPAMVSCPLPQGLALAPITEEVELALAASDFAKLDPSAKMADEMAPGVEALAVVLSGTGPVLYAATFFFGGLGGQDAMVWSNGKLTVSLQDDEDHMSSWPNTPISRALRHLGVTANDGQDEFDAIGLGNHRSNESWAEALANDSDGSCGDLTGE